MFSFGGEDIVIRRDENEMKSSCRSGKRYVSFFDYKGKENALIGREEFIPRSVQIWKMKETAESQQKRKEAERISFHQT